MRYQPDELFTSTAPYYAKFRAGCSPELFSHLTTRLGLNGTQRVLDLGTGTGAIAIPLSRHVREVIAVDPDTGMLDEGRKLAAGQGITNIDWRIGDSNRLDDLGSAHSISSLLAKPSTGPSATRFYRSWTI